MVTILSWPQCAKKTEFRYPLYVPDPRLHTVRIPNMDWPHTSGSTFSSYEEPSLQWRHNECDGVSNHRRLNCLLHRLFRHRSKKASKLRVTDICEGNPPVTGGFPSQRAVTRKMFPFYDVIMKLHGLAPDTLFMQPAPRRWSLIFHE